MHPKGTVRATGKLSLAFPKDHQKWVVNAVLDGSSASLQLGGMHFVDFRTIGCHYASDRGLTLPHITAKMLLEEESSAAPTFSVGKLDYTFASGELAIDELNFAIPARSLGFFAEILGERLALLATLKSKGEVRGTLHAKLTESLREIRLQLADDIYQAWGREHDLRSFDLHLDNQDLKITTQYRLNQHLFWLTAHSNAHLFDRGELTFADSTSNGTAEYPPLTISWNRNAETGFSIDKVYGYFAALRFNLVADKARLRIYIRIASLGRFARCTIASQTFSTKIWPCSSLGGGLERACACMATLR